MSDRDYCDTLRLLNSALVILDERRSRHPGETRARLRALSVKLALIRFRLGHRAAVLRRN